MGAGAGTENKGEAVVRERGGQMVVHEAEERRGGKGYRKGNGCPKEETGPFWAVCNNVHLCRAIPESSEGRMKLHIVATEADWSII